MSKKKKKVPEINSSSTADIAFLLLIFFLVTTTMSVDKGLARRLPPLPQEEQKQKDLEVNKRNVFVVLINSENQLLVQNEYMRDISQLKDKAKEFIVNANDDPNLPEKEVIEVDYFGKVRVTKNHVISLQNDRGTSYAKYIEVQNELVAAYNELRNDLAKSKFSLPYDELDADQQKAIQKIYPQKISEAEPKNYGGKK